MALQALITQLKTGSITDVFTRGNYQAYMNGRGVTDLMTPYVLVYDDYPINSYYTNDNTIRPMVVDVHFPVAFINELNDYVEYELHTLLNQQRLIDRMGAVFQVFVTMEISFMNEPNDDRSISGGNDDGTISRYRKIFIPRRGA